MLSIAIYQLLIKKSIGMLSRSAASCRLDGSMLSFPFVVDDLGQHHKLYLGQRFGILVVDPALIAQDNRCDAFDRFPVVLPVLFDSAEDSFG